MPCVRSFTVGASDRSRSGVGGLDHLARRVDIHLVMTDLNSTETMDLTDATEIMEALAEADYDGNPASDWSDAHHRASIESALRNAGIKNPDDVVGAVACLGGIENATKAYIKAWDDCHEAEYDTEEDADRDEG